MCSLPNAHCICAPKGHLHISQASQRVFCPPLCNAQHNEKGTSWARPPRSDSQLLLSSPLPRLVSMSHYPHCGRMQTMCFNYHSLWFCPSKYLVSGSGWESLQTSCFSGFLTVVKVVMCLLKNPTLRYRTKAFGVKTYFCPLILESTSSTCVEECCQLDVECPPRLPGTPGRWCLEGRCQSTGHAQEGDTGIQLSPSPPLCASQQTVREQSAPSGAPARKGCLKTYPEARQPRDHGQTALKP